MDEAAKKHALRLVPYGLYLAGTRKANGAAAVSLVSWFTQTSFKPPLVVVGMHREGEALQAVKETRVLALSIVGAHQKELLKGFFKHVDVKDGKAGDVVVRAGAATGCPLLPDLPAAIEVEVEDIHEQGDHATVIGRVVGAEVFDGDGKALDHQSAGLHYAG